MRLSHFSANPSSVPCGELSKLTSMPLHSSKGREVLVGHTCCESISSAESSPKTLTCLSRTATYAGAQSPTPSLHFSPMQLLAMPHRESLLATHWTLLKWECQVFTTWDPVYFSKISWCKYHPFSKKKFLGLFIQVLQCLGSISHLVVSKSRI